MATTRYDSADEIVVHSSLADSAWMSTISRTGMRLESPPRPSLVKQIFSSMTPSPYSESSAEAAVMVMFAREMGRVSDDLPHLARWSEYA